MFLLLIAYDVAFRILVGAWIGDEVGKNTSRMRFKRHAAVDGNLDVLYSTFFTEAGVTVTKSGRLRERAPPSKGAIESATAPPAAHIPDPRSADACRGLPRNSQLYSPERGI